MRARLERRAEVLVEPVGHHDLAVGIQARHEQEDDVVEDLLHLRRVLGRQPVHQLHRHLRRADLGRVNAAGDEQHELAAAGRSRRARRRSARPPWKYSFRCRLLVAIEVLQRLGRADLHHDERDCRRSTFRARGSGRDRSRADDLAHVLDDLVPPRELVVGADAEAEELLGRGERALAPAPSGPGHRPGHNERRGQRDE